MCFLNWYPLSKDDKMKADIADTEFIKEFYLVSKASDERFVSSLVY